MKKDQKSKLKLVPPNGPDVVTTFNMFELETFKGVLDITIANAALEEVMLLAGVSKIVAEALEPHIRPAPLATPPKEMTEEQRIEFGLKLIDQAKLVDAYWVLESTVTFTATQHEYLKHRIGTHKGFNTSPRMRPMIVNMAKKLGLC